MKSYGSRKFYHLPDTPPSSECGNDEFQPPGRSTKKFRSKSAHFRGSTRDLMQMIDHNIIGKDTTFQGPFGPRKSVYMDHTASGQPLRCIEGFITDNVLPYYGNTHTTTTLTSSQTTMYRHEAKDIVRNSVGASEHDSVIFCGSGATGAVHKLVQALAGDTGKPKPVVFSGPFEHHSNLLPWRDVGAKMVYIPETASGHLDIDCLEKRLQEAKDDEDNKDRLLIGCFSVGSNISGVVTDDVAVTILMHKYGGLALWDYAAAAAHVQIVMNPVVSSVEAEGMARKDALYFSGHKFVGGPQTPGVLVAKKFIFDGVTIPNGGGGGAVFFVTQDSHRYLKNVEYREEGGTPAIIESIRLGLVFRLKDTVGSHNIISQEAMYTKRAIQEWKNFPEIKILGPQSGPRLPIISFAIEHIESGYYLHYNYVVALLNDLFGIQSRGGCACAGPYGQDLLGIDLNLAKEYEDLLLEDSRLDRDHLRRYLEGSAYEIFRPGFTRLSIPFHASMAEAEFVIEAVQLVAQHGWKLLPLYTFNPETGEFHHHANHMFHHRKWLSWASFDSEGIRCKERVRNNSEDCVNYKECLEQAKNILTNANNMSKRRQLPDQTLLFDSKHSHLRWFLLPSEAQTLATTSESSSAVKSPKPFVVREYSTVEEDDQSSSNYAVESVAGSLSVYKQLLRSCWSLDQSVKVSANRLAEIDNMTEGSTGSEVNVSSNENESENEYLVPGAIVAGPSICFMTDSASTNSNALPISGLCSSNEEPVRDPRLSMEENDVIKDSRGETYGRSESTDTVVSSFDKSSVASADSASSCSHLSSSGPVCDNTVPMETPCNNFGAAPTVNQAFDSNQLLLTTSNHQQQPVMNGTPSDLPFPTTNYTTQVSQTPNTVPQASPNFQNGHYGTNSMTYNGYNYNGYAENYGQQNYSSSPQQQNYSSSPQQQNYSSSPQQQNYSSSPQQQNYSSSPQQQNYSSSPQQQNYSCSPQPPAYYEQPAMNQCYQNQNVPSVCYNNGNQLNGYASMNYDMIGGGQVNGMPHSPRPGLAVDSVEQMNDGPVYQQTTQSQFNFASPNSCVSTQDSAFYPHTPTCVPPVNEPMSVNVGTSFEYPSGSWSNGVYNGHTPIPLSPHPHTPIPTEHYNGSYPTTPMSPQVPFPGQGPLMSPLPPQQPADSIRSELVKDAMRRVTNELAIELKSELREVISQVEQGIDPEAVRERASSFSAKDKTIEGLRSRARTLSGQVLNGTLKRNLSEGHSTSFDEGCSMRGSSFPSASSPLAKGRSVDIQLEQGTVTKANSDSQIEDKLKELFGSRPPDKTKVEEKSEIKSAEQGEDKVKEEQEFDEALLRLNTVDLETPPEEWKPPKARWHCPPKSILKQTLKALNEFSMLKDGDRVLLCLSGGKDSLSMLHIMKQVQYNLKKSGISFTIGAVTVDPGSSSYNPRPLIPYLKALGVPYYYEEQGIMRNAMEKGPEEVASICSFCSRMKRGRIYACARKYDYNVIALGQHLDDLAESFLMSVFHNGLLRTMKAAYTVKEGDLRVIRPLVNVREKALRDFAETSGLPIIPENCPACFDAPKERHRMKQMLAQQEILFPKIFISLRAAMQPLLALSKTGMETKKTVGKNLTEIHTGDASDDE